MESPTRVGGAYTAPRAAGLAGIPVSTLYYWAREDIWTPSVSSTKERRWSYSDLLALRLIDWLRREKEDIQLPKTSMRRIRNALATVPAMGERLQQHSVKVWVDRTGGLRIEAGEGFWIPLSRGLAQQLLHLEPLDLVAARDPMEGLSAPDLRVPRPSLRIIPGKLSGEPHAKDTRIPTTNIAVLDVRGFRTDDIRSIYPSLTEENITEAIDLEKQIGRASGHIAA